MMLQCYIIDDELPAINILKSYVQKTPNLELVGSDTNALKALELFKGQIRIGEKQIPIGNTYQETLFKRLG